LRRLQKRGSAPAMPPAASQQQQQQQAQQQEARQQPQGRQQQLEAAQDRQRRREEARKRAARFVDCEAALSGDDASGAVPLSAGCTAHIAVSIERCFAMQFTWCAVPSPIAQCPAGRPACQSIKYGLLTAAPPCVLAAAGAGDDGEGCGEDGMLSGFIDDGTQAPPSTDCRSVGPFQVVVCLAVAGAGRGMQQRW
jgi:hypothetical protein